MLTNRYVLFGTAAAAVASALLWFGVPWADSGGRVTVTGTVLVNGKPLPSGRIQFTPDRSTSAPAVVADIENGRYALAGAEGVMPGTYRVKVMSDAPTKEQMLRQARTKRGGERRGQRRGGSRSLGARGVVHEWPRPEVISSAAEDVELGFTFPASGSRQPR